MSYKITRVETLRFVQPAAAGGATPRRDAWSVDAEVANPVSRFPEYKRHRRLWQPTWESVWVRITADNGAQGIGPCSYGRPVAAIIEDHLGPHLVGKDGAGIERLYDLLCRITKPYGTVGLASVAISGVDLALWDLAGRVADRPVYELLGGPARDRLYCYATGNHVDWYRELGFTAFKLACPYGPADGLRGLEENERLVAEARETIGDDAELMLDCYMAFDVEYTVRLAERLRPYRLRWIEEYLIPEDLDGHVTVRERLPWQGLATGEHMYTPYPFQWLAARRAVDVLQPDIQWVGGLTACRRIANLADAAGLMVCLHGGANNAYGQHLTFAMQNMPWGECFVATAPGVPLEARLPGAAVPQNGYLGLPAGPGFGVEIPDEHLEPFFR